MRLGKLQYYQDKIKDGNIVIVKCVKKLFIAAT